MNKQIPIGVSDFGRLVNPAFHHRFVDKSLFIQEIIDNAAEVTLITRPRRWGKTLNLSMLEYFLSPKVADVRTHGLFDTLAIGQIANGAYLQHQGQYPVIFVSFQNIGEKNLSLTMEAMHGLLQETFWKYEDDLLQSKYLSLREQRIVTKYSEGRLTKANIQQGLRILSQLLYKHHQCKKVYILIDEYDTPLNHAYIHHYLNDDITAFMQNMLSATLKGNPYLQKGVMTGILRISKDSMLSGLNNVEVHSVISPTYSTYFGFSDEEVSALFVDSGMQHDMQSIKKYYNGYHIGTHPCYNPWSIMQCLKHGGVLQPYWVNTANDNLLQNILWQSTPAVKTQLHRLISDAEQNIQHTIDTTISDIIRFDDILEDETALWSLLLSTGYLTILEKDLQHFNIHTKCRLAIPNQEVQSLYISIFKHWLYKKLTASVYDLFINDLVSGRIEIFTQKLEQYLLTYGSYHDFVSESNYHTFMLGLLCGLTENYFLYSNIEAGHGRADMILVPRHGAEPHAIIIEFKRDTNIEPSSSSAQQALAQIETQQYQAFIKRHTMIQRVLKIALVFNGKKVASDYQWDTL